MKYYTVICVETGLQDVGISGCKHSYNAELDEHFGNVI
jgi:hypothetical protein